MYELRNSTKSKIALVMFGICREWFQIIPIIKNLEDSYL